MTIPFWFRRQPRLERPVNSVALLSMLRKLESRHERRLASLTADELPVVLAEVDRQRVFLPEPRRTTVEVARERRFVGVATLVVLKVVLDPEGLSAALKWALVPQRLVVVPHMRFQLDSRLDEDPADLADVRQLAVGHLLVFCEKVSRLEGFRALRAREVIDLEFVVEQVKVDF